MAWEQGGVPGVPPSPLTVLYIRSCTLHLALKSLSGPELAKGRAAQVSSRKSLKSSACSSLWLLVLYSFPLCSSFRGPRQLVSELKISC